MTPGFVAGVWPTVQKYITQYFGENPQNYEKFGFPGHEGIDIAAPAGTEFRSIADGWVIWASDERKNGTGKSNYGFHVIVDHGFGVSSLYAHAAPDLQVKVGDLVNAGGVLGFSGNTGNSTGFHLHLTLKIEGEQTSTFPPGIVDPLPYLEHLLT